MDARWRVPRKRGEVLENQTQKKIEEIARAKQAQQTEPKKKGGKGCLGVFVVLALVIVAFTGFVKPGWLKKKPKEPAVTDMAKDAFGKIGDSKNDASKNFKAQTEKAKLAPEKLTASTDMGVTVELTEYILREEAELSVTSEAPVYAENGDYVILPYSVELGDLHQLKDYIRIEIPYDESFLDKGESAEDCVAGVYKNPETGEWEETLYTVDTVNKKVIIEADHFSDFGAMTIANKGLRSAYVTNYKKVFENSKKLLDMEESAAILKEYIDNKNEKSMLAGVTAFMTEEGELGNLAYTYTDDTVSALGTYLNAAYAVDLADVTGSFGYAEGIDFEKISKGVTPEKWQKVVNSYAKLGQTPAKNVFDSSIVSDLGDGLSKLGQMIAISKVAVGICESAKDPIPENVAQLYKDCASCALSFASDMTLGLAMFPVYIADQFITSAYKATDGIRYGKIENTYQYYNRTFTGDTSNGFRAGRDAYAWRDAIIELVEKNPEAKAKDLIEDEINRFANEYWKITGPEMALLLAEMPGDLRNVSQERESERKKLTKEYISQTYAELIPVMQSVQNYFSKKLEEEAKQKLKDVIDANNRQIPFVITDMYDGPESPYKGYQMVLLPLSQFANERDWMFTMGADGCVSTYFSYIAYQVAGRPSLLAVYKPGQTPGEDEPIEYQQLHMYDYSGIHIILDGMQNEEIVKEQTKGTSLTVVEDSMYSELGIELSEKETLFNAKVTVVKNKDLSLDITIPGGSSEHFKDKYYYDDEYYSYSFGGISFHAEPEEDAKTKWNNHGYYTCKANLTGQQISLESEHFEKGHAASKRVGTMAFKKGATVEYCEEDGVVYLYISLPFDLERKSTLFATNVKGSETQYTTYSGSGSWSIDCSSK